MTLLKPGATPAWHCTTQRHQRAQQEPGATSQISAGATVLQIWAPLVPWKPQNPLSKCWHHHIARMFLHLLSKKRGAYHSCAERLWRPLLASRGLTHKSHSAATAILQACLYCKVRYCSTHRSESRLEKPRLHSTCFHLTTAWGSLLLFYDFAACNFLLDRACNSEATIFYKIEFSPICIINIKTSSVQF